MAVAVTSSPKISPQAAEGLVAGDDQRGALVATGDEHEHQVRGLGVERDVADFIDLCGYPHRSIYAEIVTMPKLSCVGYSKCLLIEWFLVLAPVQMSA